MHVTTTTWIVTLTVLLGILAVDLGVGSRRSTRPSTVQAAVAVGLYVALAVVFGLWVGVRWGGAYAGQFYAGWLTEYSLSLDNLFVFLLIMARFRVPEAKQHRVLLVGVLLALVLRGVFIAGGSLLVTRFSWIFYLFGAFLVWTAVGLLRGERDDSAEGQDSAPQPKPAEADNILIRLVGRVIPTTPMLLVMLAIGTTDLLFALDSIPAIFGLTRQPFLVFTANAFALMGLMQLFFLLGGLLQRLVFLARGLAVVLAFIGAKMVLEALAANELPFVNEGAPVTWAPEVPTVASLAIIAAVLAVTAVASLARERRGQ